MSKDCETSGHCFVRVTGYGLAILPYQSYAIVRSKAEGPPALDITQGSRFARVISDNGGYRSLLDQNTTSLFDVCEIESAENEDDWRLETSRYDLALPEGATLHSTDFPNDPLLFTLVTADDHIFYTQNAPDEFSPSRLCAADQEFLLEGLSDGHRYLDYQYSHDGLGYRQRHLLVEPPLGGVGVVFTAQALSATFEQATRELNTLVATFKWAASPPN